MKIELENGKYTYHFNEAYGDQYILRYGSHWRNVTGDNFIYAMASRVKELEEQLLHMKKKYEPETLI